MAITASECRTRMEAENNKTIVALVAARAAIDAMLDEYKLTGDFDYMEIKQVEKTLSAALTYNVIYGAWEEELARAEAEEAIQ